MRGPWTLAQLDAAPRNGLTVLSTFAGGGGSSMGWRLAGFKVAGAVEIDPGMAECYRANMPDTPVFVEGVADFAKRADADLPAGALSLDVLDGSPPCSVFSMSGLREDAWGKKRAFREGQCEQVLDDLFFDFLRLVKRLQPRMFVAENVMGILAGKAKGYVLSIRDAAEDAGYGTRVFQVDFSFFGVPQKRRRAIFIGRNKAGGLPGYEMPPPEGVIAAGESLCGSTSDGAQPMLPCIRRFWGITRIGRSISDATPSGSYFTHRRVNPEQPFPTLIAGTDLWHWSEPRGFSPSEIIRAQTFPDDYNFCRQDPKYVCGMSVPPQGMRRIALQVAKALGAEGK